MKTSLFALAAVLGFASPASAGDLHITSQIDAVTVYPQGADITRLAEVKLPGAETTLLLDDLPGSVDPQSVRAEGTGNDVEILSVDTNLLPVPQEATDTRRKDFNSKIEKLGDERQTLDQLIADKDAQRKLLLSLADRKLSPTQGDGKDKAIDGEGLESLVSAVATRLEAASKSITEAKFRQRDIDKEVQQLAVQRDTLAPAQAQHLRVAVHVLAVHESTAKLKLIYRVPEAGWHAFYDARLALPKGSAPADLELVRRADVQQASGESWANVHLTLSTAQTGGAAAAPQLDEEALALARPEPTMLDKMSAAGNILMKRDAAKSAAPQQEEGEADMPATPARELKQKEAEVQVAGFNAQYVIADRASIENAGSSKKVKIDSQKLAPKLSVEAVPRLDSNAYLTAAFVTNAETPLLSGTVNLFRDGAYVGQSQMLEHAPGEDAKLGFGVDDLVKVQRNEVKRLAAEEGLFTSSATQVLAWSIGITNLHATKMPIRIIDRKPFATDAQITVTDLAGNTPPSVTDLDKKRGLLAYDLDLEPKAKAEIKTGYKVKVPENMHLSSLD